MGLNPTSNRFIDFPRSPNPINPIFDPEIIAKRKANMKPRGTAQQVQQMFPFDTTAAAIAQRRTNRG